MLTLRPYQQEAIAAICEHLALDNGENPCVVLPTGSGKSLVIAEMILRWRAACPSFRALVLQHRKELVEQNSAELLGVDPAADVGIFSAALKRRENWHAITFAGIDSVYNKASKFDGIDCIIVDEAHRIPIKGEGKYRTFINAMRGKNGRLIVVGLTATPFRLDAGPICDKHFILNKIVYEADLVSLISQGYLCKLRSKLGKDAPDLRGIHKVNGDFDKKELSERVNEKNLVRLTVEHALETLNAENRKCVIWFCVDVEHCGNVLEQLKAHGESAEMITGGTSATSRADLVGRFRVGEFRHLLNVNVFTEGFNVKQVDAICLLRPTLSKGMYWQMVGRGLRLHPDKNDCIVLDFAHLIDEHGPLTEKEGSLVEHINCIECNEYFPKKLGKCPHCGWEVPKIEQSKDKNEEPQGTYARRMHDAKYGNNDILGTGPAVFRVDDCYVSKHTKIGAPTSLRVTYRCGIRQVSEWICLEHEGFARVKAEGWWQLYVGGICPNTVDEATNDLFLSRKILNRITHLTVVKDGKYYKIIGHQNTTK